MRIVTRPTAKSAPALSESSARSQLWALERLAAEPLPRRPTVHGRFADGSVGRPGASQSSGQLSDLPRNSVEPMALKTGVLRRTLQAFLSPYDSDGKRMIDRSRVRVASTQQGSSRRGQDAGVQHEHCGAISQTEN
jgi:hypothetical protein